MRFPVNSSHMCCVELALDRLLCSHLGSRGFETRVSPGHLPYCWVTLVAKKLSVAATAPEIFARWHLVITITISEFTIPFHCRVKLEARNIDKSTNVQLLISFIL